MVVKFEKRKDIKRLKNKISEALNLDDLWEGGFDIDKVDKILNRVNSDSNLESYIELGLYAIEECNSLADAYGGAYGEEFYDYFINLFEDIVGQMCKKGLEREYETIVKRIMSKSFEGYGYQDELKEIYFNYSSEKHIKYKVLN